MLCITAYWNLYNLSIIGESKITESIAAGSDCISSDENTMLTQSFFIHEHCRLNRILLKINDVETEGNLTSINISIYTDEIELDGVSRYFMQLGGNAYISLVQPGKNNDILYVNNASVPDKVLDVCYEYEAIPIGMDNTLIIAVIIMTIFLICMLTKQYIRLIPVVLFVPAGLILLYGALMCSIYCNRWGAVIHWTKWMDYSSLYGYFFIVDSCIHNLALYKTGTI